MNNIYKDVVNHIDGKKPVCMKTVFRGESGEIGKDLTRTILAIPSGEVSPRNGTYQVMLQEDGDKSTVYEPFMPAERMIILGAGHIALPLYDFAVKCGFNVTVCDDRPDFANTVRFPNADHVICDSFENAIKQFNVSPFDYVVVITRGHRHDADCLRVLLPGTQPTYLGMIGSIRRTTGLKQMLIDEGYSANLLESIHTPIGMKIGAVTPSEIAISIMSEIIACRRLRHEAGNTTINSDSDIEPFMLNYLKDNNEPNAIVTVIGTKGSTPRRPGAKMSVNTIGKVTGSIGGGCSEAAIIHDAVNIIGTGKYKIVDINMTNDVVDSDGMVCGGIMRVLIEDDITANS